MKRNDAISIRAWVHDLLKSKILLGEIHPGDPVVEFRIAQELGVSRTPVREAFRELAREGLLTYFPNRGMFVRMVSETDVEDTYTLRMVLEVQAVRWACERMDEDDRREMGEYIKKMRRLSEEPGDGAAMTESDVGFHEMIYRFSRSLPLEQTLKSLETTILRARNLSMSRKTRAVQVVYEHEKIATALYKDDCAAACEAMRAHIAKARHEVLDALHK